jgi:hypothetical protein
MRAPVRILVAYSSPSTHTQTTFDYLDSFRRYSRHQVEYVHAIHDAVAAVDLARYDVILNSYCVRHCLDDYVAPNFREALERFAGLKILAVQDEYDRTDRTRHAIGEFGFDVVLTCVPADGLAYIYPPARFPSVRFERC